MKKLFVTLSMVAIAATSFAQSDKYTQAMEQNIAKLYQAKSSEDLQAVSASFERIGNAEKTQWLPYYYAALAEIFRGFQSPKEQMDEVATRADDLLTKAEAIEPKSAEIYIARNMTSSIHMLVDPQTRWQTYGPKGAEALATAKKLDENNPRIYFLEGQTLFGTPEQFGGGKAKAKPLLQKSVDLFATYKPAGSLYPNWGKEQAAAKLAECN